MATYLLLDGHSLAFRAWFALQDAGMRTSSGQETQAVYGFVTMTTKMLADFQPDGMAVAFDRHEPTFRDSLVADYKAGRPPTPEPLIQQVELIRQFVGALGVPAVDAIGFEADDILATLATKLRDAGADVVIVTGDRDSFQLVEDPHVRVLYNRRGMSDYVLYDEAGIVERTGVAPADYPLLASLRGDPSDNLPGVPGVGEKTAAKLVATYHDLDALYAHIDECTPKLRESLVAHEDQVRSNLRMTPLVRDVPVGVALSELELRGSDRGALERFFNFLEMRTPRDRLFAVLDAAGLAAGPVAPEPSPGSSRGVVSPETAAAASAALAGLDEQARTEGRIGLEATWAATPGRSAIDALGLCPPREGDVVVVPGGLLASADLTGSLAAVLGGSPGEPVRHRLVGHRVKELMRALLPRGVDVTTLEVDTAVIAYVLDPADGQATLDELAERRGMAGAPTAEDGQLGFELAARDVSGAGLVEATARRAELVAGLGERLLAELDAVEGRALYEEIELPLIRVLAKMEVAGIAVDVERLRRINAELTTEAATLETELHALAGGEFNVNSSTQLRTVLYDKLKLTPQRRTKTGYSTDAATLEKLRDAHPIVETLLRYREVEKLRSTYGEGLLAEVAADGRIHASFNQTVARTGRLSSDRPNLHNIPVRTDDGRRIREAFVPAAGTEFLIADYNQIELRVIAHLTGDPGLVEEFASGHDIHAATASRIYGVAPEAVTVAQRSKAKMVSYGLAYGMEAYGLAQRLGVGLEEATEILEHYFAAFPAVRSYMESSVAQARLRGYTATELGRRRYIPELASDNHRIRQAAERQAMNAGIQGLAADIFKLALVRLDAALESAGLAARIVLQVHDEVLVEVPATEHDTVETIVREAMGKAYPLSVPLEVHLSWGPTWAAAK
ncbi:MAG TPA: DNA polymerase I [Acidimicrobiales bacterium]|nr:DNA polymerase I [Acidimicrobiales bacterium]